MAFALVEGLMLSSKTSSASASILPPMRLFSRSTRRDPMGVGGDRRSSRVRLLPDSHFGGDPCKLSLIDPKEHGRTIPLSDIGPVHPHV